jgi:hypothetical protein
MLSLFQSINSMHPQLLELLNQLDERRLYCEALQDKLAQIHDARAGTERPARGAPGKAARGSRGG